MSNDSDGSKNDPLFERLFAEAEACLDRSKKTDETSEEASDVERNVTAASGLPLKANSGVKTEPHKKAEPQDNGAKVAALRAGLGLRAQSNPDFRQRSRSLPVQPEHEARLEDVESLKRAEAKIEKLQGRLSSIKDRAKRDQQMALSRQSDKLLITFLSLLDDLERAVGAAVDPALDSPQFESYRLGIKQVYDGGQQLLNQYGVRKFEAEREIFDPARHEAVRREPRSDMAANHVAEVFQAGYLIEERLLRAARVSVSVTD